MLGPLCLQHGCATSTKWPSPAIPHLRVRFLLRLFLTHLFCCFFFFLFFGRFFPQPFCLHPFGFHFVRATAGWSKQACSVSLAWRKKTALDVFTTNFWPCQQLTLCANGLMHGVDSSSTSANCTASNPIGLLRLFLIHLFCCFFFFLFFRRFFSRPFCLHLFGFHFAQATAGWSRQACSVSLVLKEKSVLDVGPQIWSCQQLTLCPSGLRGWPQVPLVQTAWAQIPQVSYGSSFQAAAGNFCTD